MEMRSSSRGLDVLRIGIRIRVAQVLTHAGVEQETVLKHDADLPASDSRLTSRGSVPSI